MADVLSQDDLDALLAVVPEGPDGDPERPLRGGAGSGAREPGAAVKGDLLSQDEIDRLFEEIRK